jgi:cytochrome c2
MKTLYILLFLSGSLYAFSADAQKGKTLYMENGCKKCHGIDAAYDPKENKVKNLGELGGWVSSCALHFKISWFPEEEEQVAKYLNETFYGLDK